MIMKITRETIAKEIRNQVSGKEENEVIPVALKVFEKAMCDMINAKQDDSAFYSAVSGAYQTVKDMQKSDVEKGEIVDKILNMLPEIIEDEEEADNNCLCCPECGSTDVEICISANTIDAFGTHINVKITSENFIEQEEILENPGYGVMPFDFAFEDYGRFGYTHIECIMNNQHPMFERFMTDETYRSILLPIMTGMAIGYCKTQYSLTKAKRRNFMENTDEMLKELGGFLKSSYKYEEE